MVQPSPIRSGRFMPRSCQGSGLCRPWLNGTTICPTGLCFWPKRRGRGPFLRQGGLALPAHPDFVFGFDAALRGGALPTGLIARDMTEGERRFPVIRRLVGEAFFTPLARLYAETDRPRTPVLAEWGAGFAGFLEGFPPLAAYPYLADVARIEFARGRAFHAADAPPVAPEILAVADPERIRLMLHPSVILLRQAVHRQRG